MVVLVWFLLESWQHKVVSMKKEVALEFSSSYSILIDLNEEQ